MYCSRLLSMNDLLNAHQIELLDNYFSSLLGGARNNITVKKVSYAVGLSPNVTSKVLTRCKNDGILSVNYGVRCPECEMLLSTHTDISEVLGVLEECYHCDENFTVSPENIEVSYSLNCEDTDESVFIEGQRNINKPLASSAVQKEDTLAQIIQAGGLNDYLFNPKDSDYDKLKDMLERTKIRNGKNKLQGDTLENFTVELFKLCPFFNASPLRTSINQIDCCTRNKLPLDYGVLGIMGNIFYIECKNESKTPSGSYISKLHSIIIEANAGVALNCVKFGIIISFEKAPSTYMEHAKNYYLINKIIIIAICYDELKTLLDEKNNLLELIERKAEEIMTNATTDLKKSGLYTS